MRYSSSESNTVSRRYELPTCLLEVWTERSPLSDWQSQIVAQNLRFRLQLEQSQRAIKGNQQQITSLIESVTSYCDRWLAQDDFESLDHVIKIPKLPQLQLSTLQLFDLYESLELCANEFVILPNVVLEVRRLSPNWLKIVAGTIAIVGVSIGTLRLISPPFSEQPSYQIASTPSSTAPEKDAASPSASADKKPDSKPESTSKIAASKSTNQSPNNQLPNSAIATAPSQSPAMADREAKVRERMDKVAAAPEPQTSNSFGNLSGDRQRATENKPSMSDGITAGSTSSTQSRRLEAPSKDSKDASAPATVISEAAKPSPSTPSSAKIAMPSAISRNDNADVVTTIKVLQVKSELPSDITTDLVRYIQNQRINTSSTGIIALNLEISGDRISNLSVDMPSSTLQDSKAISALEDLILKWRSPHSTTGKVRLVLQI
ncbi:MAG: hypothetical protein DCF19_09130 [Pseudanabaena frigida]|uniref:DUF4335 domain-containing protein n=1 Tax=Pseudanabaena frigida TaxID=945775 RepID=A0A2W4WB96_9CYAN|nr:MAG: hypothetical protein DCF19_09130 [Pseudanabaena frigida]